jgi:hypothetical protein
MLHVMPLRWPRVAAMALVIALMLTLAAALSGSAHNMEVTHPQTGETINEVWVGGDTVPADATPMFGPFNLPPSHDKALPNACQRSTSSPAVVFMAPPYWTSCEHGVP